MAYIRKAARTQEETTVVPNLTGIAEAHTLFTAQELIYANMLAGLFDDCIKAEGHKQSRIGSFQGLYEMGFNSQVPIVAKLRGVLLDVDQWETAERLIVAHGYVVTFGIL